MSVPLVLPLLGKWACLSEHLPSFSFSNFQSKVRSSTITKMIVQSTFRQSDFTPPGIPHLRQTFHATLSSSSTSSFVILIITFDHESKHLKGQLVPPVSDVTFFGPKEVSWSPPVSDVTFFGPKEVSWSPLSVT